MRLQQGERERGDANSNIENEIPHSSEAHVGTRRIVLASFRADEHAFVERQQQVALVDAEVIPVHVIKQLALRKAYGAGVPVRENPVGESGKNSLDVRFAAIR